MTKSTGWNGYYTWSIVTNDDKEKYLASFSSRKKAIEWLEKMKENRFFEVGSMEEAEEVWGLKNFKFEQTFTLNRETIVSKFQGIDLNKWSFDI